VSHYAIDVEVGSKWGLFIRGSVNAVEIVLKLFSFQLRFSTRVLVM